MERVVQYHSLSDHHETVRQTKTTSGNDSSRELKVAKTLNAPDTRANFRRTFQIKYSLEITLFHYPRQH